jgi:Glycosyltransferase family 6.
MIGMISLDVAAQSENRIYNVGLLIVATGKYITFVPPLIESANKYFCKNHKVTYFVFTDGILPVADNIVKIEQKRLGWPHDTMMRLSMYAKQKDLLDKMDYLFATDADMRFVDTVGDEILSERVGTLHPGFVGKKATYETNNKSTAHVASHEGKYYFAGGFNGGSAKEFLKMAETIANNVEIDLKNNVIAVWHDESHLNRYFIDNPPTCILSPSYCYPESWHIPYQKRLLALDKNHAEVRK